MTTVRTAFLWVALAFLAQAFCAPSALAAPRAKAKSGDTQVVARLDDREITIADLRSEMARGPLPASDPNAERLALERIMRRAMLADAARAAELHRRPEALRRMARAQEEALAELYLATVSQPPEPTRNEIDDFIARNSEIFHARRIYAFTVLTLPSAQFDEEALTPLFDEASDFNALRVHLNELGVEHALAPALQPAEAFPKAVREQLAKYDVNDNLVVRGPAETQIMKIVRASEAPIAREDAPAIARRLIIARAADERASAAIDGLKEKSSVAYFRDSAAPQTGDPER